MKKIEVKIEITNIENWSVDWDNEDEVKMEFKDLSWHIRMSLYERCGIALDNDSIELTLVDSETN